VRMLPLAGTRIDPIVSNNLTAFKQFAITVWNRSIRQGRLLCQLYQHAPR
jgi:hypothetical protein